MSPQTLYRLVWIPSAFALVAMLAIFMRQPLQMPVPGSLTRYTTADKALSIEHPDNWTPHERAAHDTNTEIVFEPVRNSRLTLSSDLMGSLFADIDRAGNQQMSNLAGMENPAHPGAPLMPGMQEAVAKMPTPLEKSHARQAMGMAKEYEHFLDGQTHPAQIAGQEALITDFTYEEGGSWMRHEMTGKRITLLSGDRHVTIVCTCLKEMETRLMPTFEKMIASVQIGQAGG